MSKNTKFEIKQASGNGDTYINLFGTPVESQYKGCGDAVLIVRNGKLSKLIYENTECTTPQVALSDEQFEQLLVENGVNLVEDDVYIGICSRYQFFFPVLFNEWKYKREQR
jgi:hypothetical protein